MWWTEWSNFELRIDIWTEGWLDEWMILWMSCTLGPEVDIDLKCDQFLLQWKTLSQIIFSIVSSKLFTEFDYLPWFLKYLTLKSACFIKMLEFCFIDFQSRFTYYPLEKWPMWQKYCSMAHKMLMFSHGIKGWTT